MNTEKVLHQLSESQKSIWYLEKAYPGTSLNNVAGNMRIKGEVCYPAFEKAINVFVKKNDSMRLRLNEKDGIAMQYVADYEEFKVDFFDFSKGGGLKDLFIWDEAKTRTPFDIIDNKLFYCALFKISDEEGGFYMKMHHLISDAWTMGLMTRQVVELYAKIKKDETIDVSSKPSYIEHLLSNEAYEKSNRFENDKTYWSNKFITLPELTVLKPQKSSENSICAKRKTMITPIKLSTKIREFCSANYLSVFTLFMSALSIYINRVTGIEDIILGTTILNRTNLKEKETAGMFVSVAAPVRISISDSMDFGTFAKAMLKENTDVMRHQKYPYNYLIRDLKKTHKFSGRLFDIVLSYQNTKFHKNATEEEYVGKWIFSGSQVESLIISVNDREDDGNLIIDYDFLTEVFDVKEIEFIHQHIISLLWHALDNPAKSIAKLEMISAKEKHTILHDFNDTYTDYPQDKTIHQAFEEQAEKTPDNAALIFDDRKMTYAELNEKSNRLAHVLQTNGVGPDKIVGLMSYRSFEMIVGIMAVLKAGGAYLPIDPDYPVERKKYMLENSGAGLLLTQHDLLGSIDFDGDIIDLEDDVNYIGDGLNLPATSGSDDLAYVIYTSGSTGNPKGVMVNHTGVVNSFCWGVKKFSLNTDSIILQKTAPTFDPSVWEIFWWLMLGGKVCLVESGDEKDPEAIISAIERYKVTTLHFVPSMMGIFLNYVESTSAVKRLASLKQVFSCGEAISLNQVEQFNRLLYAANGTKLFNMYGPTEATVEVSCFDCSPAVSLNTVPIGKRIDNFKVYILDKNRNLLPIGIPGEIYISGAGVGRGYLKSPELTSERFLGNPFVHGEKMYRTGDRARWYPKGDIEFLGRMDFQVKIKGFRIELGEIEARLLNHESIYEAAVKPYVDDGGNTYLAAFLVLKKVLNSDAVRQYLSEILPEYMVPSCIVFLDKMPLNNNGKTDRNALPKPGNRDFVTAEYVAPAHETEIVLSEIWCKVLGLSRLGVLDEYAAIGGDSLSAIKIITDIHKCFGVELSPKRVFQLQTIRKLAEYIDSMSRQINAYLHIPRVPECDSYPVSAAQKRQYIMNKIDGGVSYNLPGGMLIRGKIDAGRMENVFKVILERHESLRTSFEMRDGLPVQIIHKTVEFGMECVESEEADYNQLMETFIRPFDLSVAPLLRVRLVKITDNRQVLLFDMHHIISDGASINIIVKEFTALYNGSDLPTLKIQYKDYSAWHNELLRSEKIKKQEAYWLDKFSGEIPVLNMPLDFVRPSFQSFKGNKLHFTIDQTLKKGIRDLTDKSGSTLFMFLLSAYHVLLSKYTGQEDTIVGTPVEGRRHDDLRDIIGMFVNTLAIRSFPTGEKPFEAFLEEVKDDLLNAYDNQEYPFEELVEKVRVKRDMSRNPLFDTTFVLQNMDLSKLSAGGFTAVPYTYDNKTSKFDLTFEAVDKGETIDCSIEYCTDLFREDTIRRLSEHFINALRDVIENPAKKIRDINILSEAERHQLLFEFNDTEADYPRDKTIPQIFEEQASKTPDNIALVFKDSELSYSALNARANQLARTLREKGVGPDDIVGIIVNRSFEMLIAILGILKAGGAYLPIDPDYPAERKAYMLENSGARVLVTKSAHAGEVSFGGTIVDVTNMASWAKDASNLTPVNKPTDLAYIIYTSGSTGQPKGTLIPHKAVVNYCFRDIHNIYGLIIPEAIKRMVSVTTISFDIFVTESLLPLINGLTMILADEAEQNQPERLNKLILRQKAEILQTTPSKMSLLISDSENLAYLSIIKIVILGGEVLSKSLLEKLKNHTEAKIYNVYGPTETTVWSSISVLGTDDLTIGKPIANTQIYILDKDVKLLPIGVPGEIYIAGEGVSSGYFKNPVLTDEKFIQNPYLNQGKMYRTGDLGYWNKNGEIVYLGRNDFQIKLRGLRIELNEIEARLMSHESIESAIVKGIVENGIVNYLCAYVIVGRYYDETAIREYLRKSLPEYMIPSYFMTLKEYPMTANGKIDTNALPKPNINCANKLDYEQPENNIETGILEIWSHVLNLHDIGVLDDYFSLGGDSLKAVKIVIAVNKKFGVELSVRDIFHRPNVRELGHLVIDLSRTKHTPIPRIKDSEYFEVSAAQKRQFILNKIDGGISYNLPGGLQINGRIDIGRIEKALAKITERHESLRTSFELRNGIPVQIIHDKVAITIENITAEETDINEVMKAFVRPFDLRTVPLFRVRLVLFSNENHILLFDMHHIISDGASINILLKEFTELYNGEALPDLKIQYKDYSAWHNELLQSEKIKKQEGYWLDKFSEEIPVLNMPLDFARPSIHSFKGNRLQFTVNEQLTSEIRQLTTEKGITLFMLLLSSYNVLLSKYTGQEDIIVGTPVEGRRHDDLRGIIGMFVNTLAIRSAPRGDKTFDEFLSDVKVELLNAYDNQDYPFEQLVEKVGIKRDVSRNPLFDTTFVLQNMNLSKLAADGFIAEPYTYNNGTSKFDVTFEAMDKGKTIDYSIEYCTDLFAEETIRRLSSHFMKVLGEVVADPTKRISDIDILSEAERHQLLYEFNDTDADYPRDKTIQKVFEEQAEQTPDAVALVFKDEAMTYRELNARTNRLARTLREKGVGPDDIVGIIINRSFEMLIAILGVLKAGGAYMPIDPDYPVERKSYMLENSGARVLVTKSAYADEVSYDGTIVDVTDEARWSEDASNLNPVNKPTDLAYIIYTSGSTGQPKGVMVEHGNVIRLLFNSRFQFSFGQSDVWTLFHSYCFDFSVWEMYGALLYGGKLIVISRDEAADTRQFLNILKSEKVTILNQTPSTFYNLVFEDASSKTMILSLRYVVFGGEALKPPMLQSFKEKYPAVRLINMYGITETTVHVTFKEITLADTRRNLSNVGIPIPTLSVYIVDKYMNLLPVGVPGEICVSGEGVARGYLNDQQRTDEKFVTIRKLSTRQIYKSGDLGKRLPGGDIEYLGRIDSQVKIRGYRIELGELENALLRHPVIDETVITVHEMISGDRKLCVYFRSKEELSSKALSNYLSGRLPDYMIPAYFTRVEVFPLNRNGKIDKAKLPKPYEMDSTDVGVMPRNISEVIMANAWAEALELPSISIDDNFFELGGDSLSAVRVVSMLKLGISLTEFYMNPTVRLLTERLMHDNQKAELLVKLTRKKTPSNCHVICFPYGGGSALAYRDLCNSLLKKNADMDLYAVNLPGHDFGMQDALMPTEEIAEALVADIAEKLTGELILYGHCVGSALLLATARKLEELDIKIKEIYFGGILAPRHIKLYGWFYKPWGLYSDTYILRYLRKIGLSNDILSNTDYAAYIIKAFRHDTTCFNQYLYALAKNRDEKLKTRLYLLVGNKDITTKNYQKKSILWEKYFQKVTVYVLDQASHYFINTHSDIIIDYLLG